MTGSIAFARTLRALDADGFRGSKLGLLLVAALLASWTWRMLAGRIPQYEIAHVAQIDARRAVAEFPPGPTLDRIRPGQPAELRIDGEQRNIRAEVVSIAQDGRIELKLLESLAPSLKPQRATASIEVERLSPLAIALRASGRANR